MVTSPRLAAYPAPLRLRRFPWLMVILCGVLSLAFGAAALAMLFSPRPEAGALFGGFFAIAFGGLVWLADRETFCLDDASGQAQITRRSLWRGRRIVLPLASVKGFGVERKRIRSQRNNADMVLYTDISRPVLFASDGKRHVIFKTHRGGEWAADLAQAGNDWLAQWRAAHSIE